MYDLICKFSLPTSQANGLFDVLPGGGTNGGDEDFMAFLCP